MAHQESVLSPVTDLLILVFARPYTALLMTCVRGYIHDCVRMCLRILTAFCICACSHKEILFKDLRVAWHQLGGSHDVGRSFKSEKERTKRVESLSSSSANCPLVTVGGVGLWEVGAVVVKDVFQTAEFGQAPQTDQWNWFKQWV